LRFCDASRVAGPASRIPSPIRQENLFRVHE
jgi:hypothetical protein